MIVIIDYFFEVRLGVSGSFNKHGTRGQDSGWMARGHLDSSFSLLYGPGICVCVSRTWESYKTQENPSGSRSSPSS